MTQEQLAYEEVESAVCEIMRHDGPDGHTDGSEVLAEYIMAVLRGDGRDWITRYQQQHQ